MTGTTYDEVPYSNYPYAHTHPDRLATVAALFGMQPAPPRGARVLELGCARGGNLLPMAEQLPDAELIGIDLSERQVAEGRAAIQASGLTNVELRAGNLTEVDASWGEFDYILCHGVLSWVSETVQEHILQLFAERLRPQGVGIVSYNTYPGGHIRQAVREMMLYHVAQFDDPQRRDAEARALLHFVAEHGPASEIGDNPTWGRLMQREAADLARSSPEYVLHDHLEEHNQPFYFCQLEARLQARRLQYVADAEVCTMMTDPLPAAAAEQLQRISPNLIHLEQYLDFVRGRRFRNTIVCHEDVELSRHLTGERVRERFVAYHGKPPAPEESVDLRPGVTHAFEGRVITVRSHVPITKAALQHLRAHRPARLHFDELLERARHLLGEANLESDPDDASLLATDVLRAYLGAVLELRTEAPEFARDPGPRPCVSPYARWQAERHDFVTNRDHHRITLDPFGLQLVRLLDGTRDRDALTSALSARIADGQLTITKDDAPVTEPAQWTELVATALDRTLRTLANAAVLIA